MTLFLAYVLANMLLQIALGLLIAFHVWSGTDRSIPFSDFASVAGSPISRIWRGAYRWPGTYDPAVADYWRRLAVTTHIKILAGAVLHLLAAAGGWMMIR